MTKAEELQMGDLVIVNDCVEGRTCIKVSALRKHPHDYNIGYNTKYGEVWAKESQVEPIPLTPEILKKNGFKWNECFWVLNSPKYHHNILMRYIDEDTLEPIPDLYINHWVLDESYIIDNVHELQHALRLCGLIELANSFKV